MNRTNRRAIRIVLAAGLVLITAPACASTVTVVTHGADIMGFAGPLWDLGKGLYDYWATQPGGAVEFSYNKETLGLSTLRGDAVNAHKVIVFDWASESDRSQGGYDEAAGDALFAMLRANNLLASDYLHLIGHSRGGIVSSEAAQRILYYGYAVNQLTFLDAEEGPIPYSDAGAPYGWENIRLVDNYYGTGEGVGLGGNQVRGSINFFIDIPHTGFPAWYTESIKTLDGSKPGYYARFVEGPLTEPDTPPMPVAAPPHVVNGDFEYGVLEVPLTGLPAEASAELIPGWNYHGGAGTAHVDYVDLSDYDLEIDAGNTSKRHNWLYAPEDVYALEFDAKGEVAILQTDQFWVYLRSQDNATNHDHYIFSTSSSTAAKGWETYRVPLTAYQDSVFRFSFGLTAPGALNFIDSQVQVDNVHFLRYAPADFNRDGIVDGSDLTIWQSSFGVSADGDADHDGDADGADFLVWQRQFGPGIVSTTVQAAVPEPAAAHIVAMLLVTLSSRPVVRDLVARRLARALGKHVE